MAEKYVILDCDTGNDDAWALLSLVKAEKDGFCKILGVTCVNGNTSVSNATINTLRVLEAAGRLDIPVFKGAHTSILPVEHDKESYFHGKDGLGDLQYDRSKYPPLIQKTHAVQAMYELVCKYPGKVTLILVAPLTNVALCLNMYSDFAEKVKDIFIMGGNIKGVGNATSCAEFNFYSDPEAAFIVLSRMSCPITILPWEPCLDNRKQIPLAWRFDVLGSVNNRITQLMNPVEKAVYVGNKFTTWVPCDALLATSFLFPDKVIAKKSLWHATVELNGKHTRGQMVLDHVKNKNRQENVYIIEDIDFDNFKDIALSVADQCCESTK